MDLFIHPFVSRKDLDLSPVTANNLILKIQTNNKVKDIAYRQYLIIFMAHLYNNKKYHTDLR
jgi:hypothetical protein